jgi:hypothetical protein
MEGYLSIIIVILSLVCGILFWAAIRPRRPLVIGPMNMMQDIEFLMYIIQHKIHQYERFFLEPSQMAKSVFVDDDDFKKYQERLIHEIIGMLSPSYRLAMSKYFTERALYRYIAEVVTRELSMRCVGMNMRHFNSNIKSKKQRVTENGVITDDSDHKNLMN